MLLLKSSQNSRKCVARSRVWHYNGEYWIRRKVFRRKKISSADSSREAKKIACRFSLPILPLNRNKNAVISPLSLLFLNDQLGTWLKYCLNRIIIRPAPFHNATYTQLQCVFHSMIERCELNIFVDAIKMWRAGSLHVSSFREDWNKLNATTIHQSADQIEYVKRDYHW